MDLILWRHAEAENGSPTLPDHKRRLTARGEKQARKVARWLHQHLPRKPGVLVSPAERTQQTAHMLDLPYRIEPALDVGASASSVLKVAGWPDYNGAILIIGHQPTLGRVASLLLGGNEDDWSLKKGGVWWFTRRKRDDGSRTLLRAVINPDFV